jgi:hypothetical protein
MVYWKDFKNVFEKKMKKHKPKGMGVVSIRVIGPIMIFHNI